MSAISPLVDAILNLQRISIIQEETKNKLPQVPEPMQLLEMACICSETVHHHPSLN